jgi:hypothetical protein
LTGSSTPNDKFSLHSGAGRIAQISLDTLSFYEISMFQKLDISYISIKDLFNNDEEIVVKENFMKFQDICEYVLKGG